MTQPVSNGARWAGADLTCSDPDGADREELTCDETPILWCAAERAQRIARTEPTRDAGASGDAGTRGVKITECAPHAVEGSDRACVDRPKDARPRTEFCQRANTVVEGFLCNDPTIVSNACRKPTNAFDEFVCDEPRMQASVVHLARDLVVREDDPLFAHTPKTVTARVLRLTG